MVIFSDDFNRQNSSSLGSNWDERAHGGVYEIADGKLRLTGQIEVPTWVSTTTDAHAPIADCRVTVKPASTPWSGGVGVRIYDDGEDLVGYAVFIGELGSGQWEYYLNRLYHESGGTTIDYGVFNAATISTVALEVEGTNPVILRLKINGNTVATYQDSSNDRITSAGQTAVVAWTDIDPNEFDDFLVEDLSAGPVLTDIDTDERVTLDKEDATFSGANLSGATLYIVQGDVEIEQDITSNNGSSGTFDVVGDREAPLESLKCGPAVAKVTTSEGTDTLNIVIDPPDGVQFVDIEELADESEILETFPELEVGDQVQWRNVQGGELEVFEDGSIVRDAEVTSAEFRVWDHNDATYGDWQEVGFAAEDDDEPDAFEFEDATDVEPNTVVVSNEITVSGINVPVAISVSGGEYSVNGGAWTSSAGTVENGDKVRVRHTSSQSFEATVTTTLTIGGVSDTFSSTTRAADTTPDAFEFEDQDDVERNTVITSNEITVSGIEVAVPISVTGGEYSINNGAWTSSAGTVENGDKVRVRHTSSSSFSTSVNTVLTIGGVSDTFTSTTRAPITTPEGFSFDPLTDVEPGQVQVSNAITVTGIEVAVAISVANGEYQINDGGWTSTAGTVNAGDQVRVRHTSSSNFETTVTTTLTIGGVSADFKTTTRAADTEPDAFSFPTKTGVERETVVVSDSIVVTGIEVPVSITITAGEYDINESDDWTSEAGTVEEGDAVRVRHTSSSDYGSPTMTTVTIGGVSATFTSVTVEDPAAANVDEGAFGFGFGFG